MCESSFFLDSADTIVGVILGALITYIPSVFSCKRKIHSYKASLKAEIEACQQMATTYNSEVAPQAPSYRLPKYA